MDAALHALAAIDEVALVAAPGMTSDTVRDKLVAHCSNTADRFAILDGPEIADSGLTGRTRSCRHHARHAPKRTDLAAWYFRGSKL